MWAIAFGLVWVVLHFTAYALRYRHSESVNNERGIFLFHVRSFAAAVCFALIVGVFHAGWDGLAAATIVAGIHAIYSMTKLEIWALVDGGLSATVLHTYVGATNERHLLDSQKKLEQVGDEKRVARISALQSQGLITSSNEVLQLTVRGRYVASLVSWLSALLGTSPRQ